jgi:hypothetical protein
VALIIIFQNDGTGDEKIGNYNVKVMINELIITEGRVEGHLRESGWMGLVKRLVYAGAYPTKKEPTEPL